MTRRCSLQPRLAFLSLALVVAACGNCSNLSTTRLADAGARPGSVPDATDVSTSLPGDTDAPAFAPDPMDGLASPPRLPTGYAMQVTVRLTRISDGATTVSFGVPVKAGTLVSADSVRLLTGGKPVVGVNLRPILWHADASGKPTGVAAIQVQFPASELHGDSMDVDVVWKGTGDAPGTTFLPFATEGVSGPSPFAVDTVVRTIKKNGSVNQLVDGPVTTKTLFVGREPRILATFPDDYLPHTRILGEQIAKTEAGQPGLAGMKFLSDAALDNGLSAIYAMKYPLNPDGVDDPVVNFEGWLYDRCATFLILGAHTAETRLQRHALKTCSYFASQITLDGPNVGIFKGKPDPDPKYSHVRGLYVYYALTGDESALKAGTAVASLWEADTLFVAPYRAGHLRGPDKLWTERLLGTSMEGLLYGHRLTGEVKYLTAMREMVDTAYRHITGDAAALALINPGVGPFPPQNCFVHSSEQHSEGGAEDPWCSGWMSELAIEPLLRYQEQTNDNRVDEIFIRLVRFIRDVGSQYFRKDPLGDTFMAPSICFDPTDENARILTPMYGAGLYANGTRADSSEWSDFAHCPDATALTSMGLRALKRQKLYDSPFKAPFASEGESFLQLHHELAACARSVFVDGYRPRRAPSTWTSAQLADGVANPAKFIADNKIGFPVCNIAPIRELSWWFNTSMFDFSALVEAGVGIPALTPGKIQPATCK